MLQRTLPAGFIAPCLPSKTDKLPSGSDWLHEIKHDGLRIIARKRGAQLHPAACFTAPRYSPRGVFAA
jgi:ATP-dependent DNA ligase